VILRPWTPPPTNAESGTVYAMPFRRTFLILEAGDQIGYAAWAPSGQTALVSVAVDRARRRQGHGLAALRLLLGLAISGPEIDDAELVTDKANDAAVALAKRAGFELASVQGNTARWRIPRERLALLRMAEAMPA